MSEKNPNDDHGKYQEKRVLSEQLDHSSHQEYQKLLEKIDNCLDWMIKLDEKLDNMTKDPQEDYENFDTPTKLPSYFTELVSIFDFLTGEIQIHQTESFINWDFKIDSDL